MIYKQNYFVLNIEFDNLMSKKNSYEFKVIVYVNELFFLLFIDLTQNVHEFDSHLDFLKKKRV